GHNILEPAAFGKVPVFGPSMENFAAMATRFVESHAAIQVESPEDAGVEMIHLLKDPEKMRRMGATARQLVETSRGALDRALSEITKHLGGAGRGTCRHGYVCSCGRRGCSWGELPHFACGFTPKAFSSQGG